MNEPIHIILSEVTYYAICERIGKLINDFIENHDFTNNSNYWDPIYYHLIDRHMNNTLDVFDDDNIIEQILFE